MFNNCRHRMKVENQFVLELCDCNVENDVEGIVKIILIAIVLTIIVIIVTSYINKFYFKNTCGNIFESIDEARSKVKGKEKEERYIDTLERINVTYEKHLSDWPYYYKNNKKRCGEIMDILYKREKYLNYCINSYNVIIAIVDAASISLALSLVTFKIENAFTTIGFLGLIAIMLIVFAVTYLIHIIIELNCDNSPNQYLQEYELSLLKEKKELYSKKCIPLSKEKRKSEVYECYVKNNQKNEPSMHMTVEIAPSLKNSTQNGESEDLSSNQNQDQL